MIWVEAMPGFWPLASDLRWRCGRDEESYFVSTLKKETKRERAIAVHNPPGPPLTFKPEFTKEVERLCKLGVRDVDLCLFF
jgi:hypothetical protein